MLSWFSSWIYTVSKGWVALTGLVVFILFTILVLPAQTAAMQADSAGAGTPDLSFFYSPEDLYHMAESYGAAGRQAYINSHLTFDVAWPLVYLFFLSTSISWLLNQSLPAASRLRRLNLLPFGATLLDFGENFSNILVMARFPARTMLVDWLAPAFTLLKWITVGACIALLLASLVWALANLVRRRKHAA